MKHYLELYVTRDEITKEQWQKLCTVVTQQLGSLAKFQIIVAIQDNVVRFFVGADKDISQLSNNIDMGILRTVENSEIKLPVSFSRESFVQFVTGGNILDLKEKVAVKRAKQLEFLVLNVRAINVTRSIVNAQLFFKNSGDSYTCAKKMFTFFPSHLLAVDFATNTNYLRKTSPKYLNIEKTLNLFESSDVGAVFSISTFPYFSSPRYLPLNSYEFDKHSFIIGATGSGKSKLIQLYIERLARSQNRLNYRVIVIDPHDNLRHDLEGIPDSYIVNFANETTELFGGEEVQTDVSAATELTTSLMKSLLADQFNARLERVLRFSLFVLLVAKVMSLDYLKRFLTDIELRNEIMKHVGNNVPQNIKMFFASDFNEIRTTHYNEAILPIVSLVDEMQLQPALVSESEQSLAKLVQSNYLTVFSLNKVTMGEKVVKTVSGLLIQQIFLLAQARAFTEHVILIIDEVSVVQNPALASILAEARKFNLSVILTQQYFGQIEKDLRDAIFANVYNYYTFRVSEEDAQALAGNLNMEIPKEIVESEQAKGVKEEQLKIKFLTELNPRECLLRISANGQVLPCFKAKTMDVSTSDNKRLKGNNQPAEKAKLEKFVEGQAQATPTLPGHASKFTPPVMPTPAPHTVQNVQPSEHDSTQPEPIQSLEFGPEKLVSRDSSLKFGVSGGPEQTDMETEGEYMIPNPELDPAQRQQISDTSNQPLATTPRSVPPVESGNSTYLQPSMSLSELLASQSSARKK